MANENVKNYLNKKEKQGAFRTSFLDIDPNLWVPYCFEKSEDGTYLYLGEKIDKIKPENNGTSRNGKFWILDDEGNKWALFGKNFEHHEHMLNLIYCACADFADVPCMSSVPAKCRDIGLNGEVIESKGLLSLNVCTNKCLSLIDFENRVFNANKNNYSIKNLKNAVQKFIKNSENVSIDKNFESDLAKLVLLDYCTANGDKKTYANYAGAEIKTGENATMVAVAPAMDNGLCFGVMSGSRWLVNTPEKCLNACEQINSLKANGKLEEADEAFYKEFRSVAPIMPYRPITDYECVRFDSPKWGKYLLQSPVMVDNFFKDQMCVMMMQNPDVMQTFDKIKTIKMEDVRKLLLERFPDFEIDQDVFKVCQSVFEYRVNALNENLKVMQEYKEKNPENYNGYVESLQGEKEVTDYQVRYPDIRINPKRYGVNDFDYSRGTDYINPNAKHNDSIEMWKRWRVL